MIAVTIIAVGRLKDRYIAALADQYVKWLAPYVRLRMIEVEAQPFSASTIKAAQAREEEMIGRRLEPLAAERVFLLSEDGRLPASSPDFSRLLDGSGETVFVIGGASGFSRDFKEKYPRLSLSPLTFPHELARLVLLEQVYRAATIAIGKDYHY